MSWPLTWASRAPASLALTVTGGTALTVRFSPSTISPAQTTSPSPLRTTTFEPACAPTRVTRIGFAAGAGADGASPWSASRVDAGRAVQHRRGLWSSSRRLGGEQAHDAPGHHQREHHADEQRPVRAADRAAHAPGHPGRQLGLEHPAGVDRRGGVAVVELREQRRRVLAEHARQRAQVAAGVEVAAAGREVVDLDRLDDVRADPGALGELVDAQPDPDAGGGQLGTDDRVVGRLGDEVVDDQRVDGLAERGDRADPAGLEDRRRRGGLELQVDAARTAQLAALRQRACDDGRPRRTGRGAARRCRARSPGCRG